MSNTLKEALTYYNQKNYTRVIALLKSIEITEPKLLEILGLSFYHTGELNNAENIYNTLLKLHPNTVTYSHMLGLIYKENNNYNTALQFLKNAIRLDHTFVPSIVSYSEILRITGSNNDEIEFLLSVYDADKSNIFAIRRLGELYSSAKNYAQAILYYKRIIELHKETEIDISTLAACYYATDPKKYAVENLQKLTSNYPSNIATKKYLARSATSLGEYELAKIAIEQSLAINPNEIEALHYLGENALATHDYLTAVSAYQKILTKNPTDIGALNNAGIAYNRMEKNDEAFSCFKSIIAIAPDNVGALIEHGKYFHEKGDFARAIEYYDRVLAIEPNNSSAYFNIGISLHELGEYSESIKYFIEAISRRPNFADAYYNLSLNLLALGQFQNAWRLYFQRERFIDPNIKLSPIQPGQNLNGKKLLVLKSQGLGDELFFLRFLPQLKSQGAWIAYNPGEKISSLVKRLPFIDHTIESNDTIIDHDYCFSVDDLPLVVDMKSESDIPKPYALAPMDIYRDETNKIFSKYPSMPLIGIAWRAGTDKRRISATSLAQVLSKSIPLNQFVDGLSSMNAIFVVLQRNPTDDEIALLRNKFGDRVVDVSYANDNLELMLAILHRLDHYVGVSSTNIHLHTMTGKSANILVPYPPEWRWMESGKSSPWFPQFAVHRQKNDGSWSQAFSEIAQPLSSA